MLEIIPIAKLQPSPGNPRRQVGDVRDLVASISALGVLEPLIVVAHPDGGYEVVAGHRRLAAAAKAGLSEVPCTVKELSEAERLEVALVENLVRSDLRPIEEAAALFRLVEMGQTTKALARRIGRSVKHITGRLALLELPPRVQAQIDAGKVTVAEGTALLALKDHPDAIDALLVDEWRRGDIERQVVREAARVENEAKAESARSDLTAQGVTLIEDWSPYRSRARGPAALGDGPGELPVAVDCHRQEPCHAAHVGPRGEVTYLCSDPARHATGGASGLVAESDNRDTALDRRDERASERQEARARTVLAKQRIEFASELLARRLPKADTTALVLDQFLASARPQQARSACALLGIPPTTGPYGEDWPAALQGHAQAAAAQRDRAVLALALALGDEAARQSAPSSLALRYRRFLTTFGFEDPETDDPAATAPYPSDDSHGGRPSAG